MNNSNASERYVDDLSIKETKALIAIPGMKEKLIAGMKTPLDECIEDTEE